MTQSANGEFLLERPGQVSLERGQAVQAADRRRRPARVDLRRGPEPGDRAQDRRRAGRHARRAALRQPGRRARVHVEGPAGGRWPRMAVGDADLEGDDVRGDPARASTRRASRRSSSTTRSARRASVRFTSFERNPKLRRSCRSCSRRPRARTSSATSEPPRSQVRLKPYPRPNACSRRSGFSPTRSSRKAEALPTADPHALVGRASARRDAARKAEALPTADPRALALRLLSREAPGVFRGRVLRVRAGSVDLGAVGRDDARRLASERVTAASEPGAASDARYRRSA